MKHEGATITHSRGKRSSSSKPLVGKAAFWQVPENARQMSGVRPVVHVACWENAAPRRLVLRHRCILNRKSNLAQAADIAYLSRVTSSRLEASTGRR